MSAKSAKFDYLDVKQMSVHELHLVEEDKSTLAGPLSCDAAGKLVRYGDEFLYSAPTAITDGTATLDVDDLFALDVQVHIDGDPITLTTPTAALIVAKFTNPVVGSSIRRTFVCGDTATATITFAAGVGVTLFNAANKVIPLSSSRDVILRCTNVTSGSEAVTLYLV
jgi:hypothetical protein